MNRVLWFTCGNRRALQDGWLESHRNVLHIREYRIGRRRGSLRGATGEDDGAPALSGLDLMSETDLGMRETDVEQSAGMI